jgi:hypothetical protein
MWLFLWFVLSAILIGATLWSLQILMRQKRAWEKFAKVHHFNYAPGTFMGPAEMSGVIGDYRLAFFTAERRGDSFRTTRYVTALEITRAEGLIDGGALGTQEMLPFLQSLDKTHPFPVENANWKPEYFVFVKYDEPARSFFTPERLEIFAGLLGTRNADVLVLFNDKELVVRLETSDPMQDPEKMDKIVKRILAICDKLRISAEDRARYAALAPAASTES